jgi:hypothetical protein
MVLDIAPFILLLLSWSASSPKDSMAVEKRLMVSEAECRMHGAEFVAQREIYKEEFKGRDFQYFCIPAPSQKEISDMIENEK